LVACVCRAGIKVIAFGDSFTCASGLIHRDAFLDASTKVIKSWASGSRDINRRAHASLSVACVFSAPVPVIAIRIKDTTIFKDTILLYTEIRRADGAISAILSFSNSSVFVTTMANAISLKSKVFVSQINAGVMARIMVVTCTNSHSCGQVREVFVILIDVTAYKDKGEIFLFTIASAIVVGFAHVQTFIE
jgi:hypothetical protein